VLPLSPSEYVHRNVWLGFSFPSPSEVAAREVLGTDRLMWGSDYPHHEGTFPYTREHLRRSFHDVADGELRMMLSGNIASVYGFDLDALAPLAAEVGPTVDDVHTPLDAIPAGATSPAFYRG
jgi:predicted TIM-barrel fold metal-dependent hydrolase